MTGLSARTCVQALALLTPAGLLPFDFVLSLSFFLSFAFLGAGAEALAELPTAELDCSRPSSASSTRLAPCPKLQQGENTMAMKKRKNTRCELTLPRLPPRLDVAVAAPRLQAPPSPV